MTRDEWLDGLNIGDEAGTWQMVESEQALLVVVRSTPKYIFTNDGRKWKRETGEVIEPKRAYFGADNKPQLEQPERIAEERVRRFKSRLEIRLRRGEFTLEALEAASEALDKGTL